MKKFNITISKWLAMIVFASIIASPSFALAKNDKSKNNNNGNNKVAERQEIRVQENEQENEQEVEHTASTTNKSSTKKCFQAWGHLIAPGWIKWNGNVSVPDNCIMPFGIGKKFKGSNGGTSTSTSDTIAPIISKLVITPNRYSANVSWSTNELADSKIFYSTTSPVDFTTATLKSNLVLTKNHSINISGLSSSTTYYIVVTSKDSAGNVATSSQTSFTTLAPIADTVPPVISNVIATVGSTTLNVGWKTNENSTTKVYYSTTTPVNLSSSSFVENNSLLTTHFTTISGLATSTTYYLILESKDASGNIQRTDEFSTITTSGL